MDKPEHISHRSWTTQGKKRKEQKIKVTLIRHMNELEHINHSS